MIFKKEANLMTFKGRPLHIAWLTLVVLAFGILAVRQSRAQAGADQLFRVIILDHQTQAKADEGKRFMESLGYTPIAVDQQDGSYRVLYGNFASQPAAVKAKETLDGEGIRNFGVTAGVKS